MLKWVLCDSEVSNDDFHFFGVQINADYFCKNVVAAAWQHWVF